MTKRTMIGKLTYDVQAPTFLFSKYFYIFCKLLLDYIIVKYSL